MPAPAIASTREGLLHALEQLIREFYQLPQPAPAAGRRVPLSSAILGPEEAAGVLRTVLSGWISQGPLAAEFERRFAAYVGVAHAVAVNSGSSANLLLLAALLEDGRLRTGDEVVIPATTFSTVASPIIQLGLVPVYADVEPDTFNLDPAAAEVAIGARTRALMPVHTLGYPAAMPALMELARRRGLLLIEDCCEAHGAALDGRRVGGFGDAASFSFFVAHNMTTGEGGMVLTNDKRLAALCRSLREFGRMDQRALADGRYFTDERLTDYDKRYVFERLGYNVRMTDVAAAIGVAQLARLEAFNAARREAAAAYTAALAGCQDVLELPRERPGVVHSYYTYPMVIREAARFSRRELAEHLEAQGIETRPLFAGCLPDQPGFRSGAHRVAGALPVARRLRDRALFIGVHPGLAPEDVAYAAGTIRAFVEARR